MFLTGFRQTQLLRTCSASHQHCGSFLNNLTGRAWRLPPGQKLIRAAKTAAPEPRPQFNTGSCLKSADKLAEELQLPREKIGELIGQGIAYKPTIKIGRRGVYAGLRKQLETRLRNVEVVKLEAPHSEQHRIREIGRELEELLPVHTLWCSGSKVVIYRGPNYQKPDAPPPVHATHEDLERELEPDSQATADAGSDAAAKQST